MIINSPAESQDLRDSKLKNEILSKIKKKTGNIHYCFLESSKYRINLQRSAKLAWNLNKNGQIEDIEWLSGSNYLLFKNCVLYAARNIKFPKKLNDSSRVTYEFDFSHLNNPITDLDRSRISEIIKQNNPAIRSCYEKELKRDPKYQAKVKIAWEITKEGEVENPQIIEGDPQKDQFESCLVRTFYRFSFALPIEGKNIAVTFPFIFKIKEDKAPMTPYIVFAVFGIFFAMIGLPMLMP